MRQSFEGCANYTLGFKKHTGIKVIVILPYLYRGNSLQFPFPLTAKMFCCTTRSTFLRRTNCVVYPSVA
ncbi:hypothetical protein HOLleu_11413 [Holothuria leucospilota]|uniref:Uncharacterized protein n=1 Tax=Holothuria leucospilota TaxID=206669 RepID=A0A9Q1CEN5_HOLLE|nr:hypothetical protein HOLleu_11413 [Holothuria leucospilota]